MHNAKTASSLLPTLLDLNSFNVCFFFPEQHRLEWIIPLISCHVIFQKSKCTLSVIKWRLYVGSILVRLWILTIEELWGLKTLWLCENCAHGVEINISVSSPKQIPINYMAIQYYIWISTWQLFVWPNGKIAHTKIHTMFCKLPQHLIML